MDGFELLGGGLEALKGGGVADVAEEEESGDGSDQEEEGDDFVEIFGGPCGEIEVFGAGEARRMESW